MRKKMKIKIVTEFIKLDSALKYCGVCDSGSYAKEVILMGQVSVNGEVEKRRGRKLYKGDTFKVFDKEYEIE
ncbi:MAG: RNA-binding S4 domain-containing protein [Clostridia bacterium]|nr:RNA-binding S4 domain-containing protein [Clostridia bacterium]